MKALTLAVLACLVLGSELEAQAPDIRAGVVEILASAPGQQAKRGSGAIVKLAGASAWIVTVAHVIEGDPAPEVVFFSQPGRRFPAKVVGLEGGDPRGLAVLLVEGQLPSGLTVLPLGEGGAVSPGEEARMVGFPRTAATGWAVTRVTIAGQRGGQLTVAGIVQEGHSGSPVLVGGKIVGLVTRGDGGFGYAETSEAVRYALRGWGVQVDPLPAKSRELLATAGIQSESGDFAPAWGSIEQALALSPDATELRNAQALLAMKWLRNIRVSPPQTFSEIVDRVSPSLYRGAAGGGSFAADCLAHIGYANFLRYREGKRGLAIEENFKRAIATDPQNVYGHAFLGFWILWQGTDLDAARAHFATALNSRRERTAVLQFQLAAWENRRDWASRVELVRIADQMRTSGETLDADTRSRIDSTVYYGELTAVVRDPTTILPPADHLATYLWLNHDAPSLSLRQRLVVARLTEATGDLKKGLELYRALQRDADYGQFTYRHAVEEGIKRCEAPR